ncbi:MAG: phosphatase PAP2 family protein, partial [Pseudomonadota bacterium]
ASYIVLVIPIVGVLHYMTRQSFGNRNGRVLIFLLLAIIVGPGLVVNLVFKENWGRARPYQTENFGRDKQFTPALVMTDQCPRNCSFVSGDVSFVVAFSALVMLARNRRRMLIGASALAVAAGLMSFQRIMLGSHFLSDTLFSIFFTLGITWALYQLIVRRKWRDCWHWIESKDARWLAHKEKLRKEG